MTANARTYARLLDLTADRIAQMGHRKTGDGKDTGYTLVGALNKTVAVEVVPFEGEIEGLNVLDHLKKTMRYHLATPNLLRWNNRWYRTQAGVVN